MKPTLDEEIREIAEIAIPQNVYGPVGREKAYERKDIIAWTASAIYAGIEAWKRQEPSAAIIAASITAMETGITSSKHERMRLVYRAMMSASLRTSETTGEGK